MQRIFRRKKWIGFLPIVCLLLVFFMNILSCYLFQYLFQQFYFVFVTCYDFFSGLFCRFSLFLYASTALVRMVYQYWFTYFLKKFSAFVAWLLQTWNGGLRIDYARFSNIFSWYFADINAISSCKEVIEKMECHRRIPLRIYNWMRRQRRRGSFISPISACTSNRSKGLCLPLINEPLSACLVIGELTTGPVRGARQRAPTSCPTVARWFHYPSSCFAIKADAHHYRPS